MRQDAFSLTICYQLVWIRPQKPLPYRASFAFDPSVHFFRCQCVTTRFRKIALRRSLFFAHGEILVPGENHGTSNPVRQLLHKSLRREIRNGRTERLSAFPPNSQCRKKDDRWGTRNGMGVSRPKAKIRLVPRPKEPITVWQGNTASEKNCAKNGVRFLATSAWFAAGAGAIRPGTLGRRFVAVIIPAVGTSIFASVSFAPEFCGTILKGWQSSAAARPLRARSAGTSFGDFVDVFSARRRRAENLMSGGRMSDIYGAGANLELLEAQR